MVIFSKDNLEMILFIKEYTNQKIMIYFMMDFSIHKVKNMEKENLFLEVLQIIKDNFSMINLMGKVY
jgi:hypothetical protein